MLRIKELCSANKVQQKDVAKDLRVSPSTLSQYGTGKVSPDVETLARIADYFCVSVDYLIGRTDDPNPVPKEERIFVAANPLPGYDELSDNDKLLVEGYVQGLRARAHADERERTDRRRM